MIRGSTSGLFMFFGKATVIPCCRNGVTTMKMISRTSIMSTIGVTLISDWTPPPPPPPDIPITKSPFYPVNAGAALTNACSAVTPHLEVHHRSEEHTSELQSH